MKRRTAKRADTRMKCGGIRITESQNYSLGGRMEGRAFTFRKPPIKTFFDPERADNAVRDINSYEYNGDMTTEDVIDVVRAVHLRAANDDPGHYDSPNYAAIGFAQRNALEAFLRVAHEDYESKLSIAAIAASEQIEGKRWTNRNS